ncbi:hypothetical protein [Haloferula sp. A504]|uniref:hypothetical protein n=1 Tax=Haloferula sp. A504 TaxID=3373601 RepID=UPI0031BD13EE|nr:hypothetical protein [Verrucomicrobiaceae bacterium E54]
MKRNVWWIGLAVLALPGCEKQEKAPRATVVVEQEEAVAESSGDVTTEPSAPEVPPALPVPEPEEDAEESPTVGERVDQAIEATGTGLQTAGEKTREGVATAAEKTGEALQTAGEKTEEGVRKGAEATGRFLKKVGERIEDAATGGESEGPAEPQPADP